MEPAGYHECLVRPSMVGEAAIIGQQLRLTVLADVPWAAAVRGDDGRHVTPLRTEEDVSGALLASLCGCGPQIGPRFSKGGDRWSLFIAAALCAPGNREIRAEISVRLAVRADLAVSATPRGGAA